LQIGTLSTQSSLSRLDDIYHPLNCLPPLKDEVIWYAIMIFHSASQSPAESALFDLCSLHVERIRALEVESEQLHNMFDQAPGFMAVLRSPSHVYEIVNRAYYQLIGHRDSIGKPVVEVLPELIEQGYLALLDKVYSSGKPFVGREMLVTFQHEPNTPTSDIYVDFLYQPLFDSEGQVTGIFVQGQNVTEQKITREALHASNERLKFALEGARDGIWDWSVLNNAVAYSKRWKEIIGYTEDELEDEYDTWVKLIHPIDRAATLEAIKCVLNEQSLFHVEYRLRCKDGSYKWVLSRGVVVERDKAGRPTRLAGTMSDISEKKASEELIWRHASFDTLTGLPNRRLFRDRLEQEMHKAHRTGNEIALLYIDLDHFKEVNDLLGHDAGDKLLAQVASRLRACVRDSDTVARLGGDEFTVILTDLHGHPHIESIAQKIIQKLAKPFRLQGEVAHISASVGITLCPADAADPEELMRNADQAMYAAKGGGEITSASLPSQCKKMRKSVFDSFATCVRPW
jgi:diguanylate cyclase (GGDEF)-like protein/PAS domain S-box-containing protein